MTNTTTLIHGTCGRGNFTASDDYSKVYCLVCGEQDVPTLAEIRFHLEAGESLWIGPGHVVHVVSA